LSAFPLYHAGELHGGLLPRIQVGTTTIIHHEFDPVSVSQDIEAHNIKVLFAASTGWVELVEAADSVAADIESLIQRVQ